MIARVDHNCWKLSRADRMAFLVDGRDYFERLADTLERAQRSVWIVGWDLHSRTPLRESAGEAGRLGPFLSELARSRPDLHVHLLVWDCNAFYKMDREKLQTVRLGWQTHPRVRLQFDSRHRVEACHHQKIVVVDDEVAFVGGIDLTARRRDTSDHAPDAERLDPSGARYRPFHDVQVALAGPAARDLGRLVRDRWGRATGEETEPTRVEDCPWPPSLPADLEGVEVGIARTDHGVDGASLVREIETLYLDAIAAARHWIYVENQYLTSDAVGGALVEVLRRAEGPEVVIVGPREASGWLEQATMGALRARLAGQLREADHADRLRLWYLDREGLGERSIMVHSKICVVDDRWLTVGSANLSNRSMGLDTECNVFLETDDDDRVAGAIAGFRDRLLAEHLGRAPGELSRALREHGSLIRAVESLRGGERTLAPLEADPSEWSDVAGPAKSFVDPERPIDWGRLVLQFLEPGS